MRRDSGESGQENSKAGLTTGAGRGRPEQPRDVTEEARHGEQVMFHEDTLEAKTPALSLTMGHLKHREQGGKEAIVRDISHIHN